MNTFQPFVSDLEDEQVIAEARLDLSLAGDDEARLAAWARKYAASALYALDDASGFEEWHGEFYEEDEPDELDPELAAEGP